MWLRPAALLGFALLASTVGAAKVSHIDKVEDDALFAEAFAQFVPPSSDPSGVAGFFGFHKNEKDSCQFSGYFDGGLTSSNPADYKLKIESNTGNMSFNLSKIFQAVKITPPRSTYFHETFPNADLNCLEVPGKTIVLYFKGDPIARAPINAIE